MKITFLLGIMFYCCLYVTNVFAEEKCAIEIQSFAWTDGVERYEPKNQYKNKSTIQINSKLNPLHFWTKLRGTQSELDCLIRQKKLPIHHIWFFDIAGYDMDKNTEFSEEFLAIDNISLDREIPTFVFEKLGLEIKDREEHYFDWRTWSAKKNISSGDWKVEVQYHDGSCVLQEGKCVEHKIKVIEN